MNESQSTVEIPKGQPDQLRSAAARYTGIDQALSVSETQLMNASLSVGTWQGEASIGAARAAKKDEGGSRLLLALLVVDLRLELGDEVDRLLWEVRRLARDPLT